MKRGPSWITIVISMPSRSVREHHARRANLHVHVALVVIEGVDEQDVALEDVLLVRAAAAEIEEARRCPSASRRGARRPGRARCR